MLNKLLNLGVTSQLPQEIAWRIRITNGIVYFLIFFALIFVIPAIFTGTVISQSFVTIGVYSVVLLLNKFGAHKISRLVISLLPASVIALIHLSLLPAGAFPSASLYFLQVSLSFVPWLVFSFKEKGMIFFLSAINFIMLISYKWDLGLGETEMMDMMEQDFENEVMGYMVVAGAFVVLAGLFYAVNFLNSRHTEENEKLIEEMEQNQQQMEVKTQELNEFIEQVNVAKKQDEQRQWLSDGLAQINKLIQDKGNEQHDLKDELLALLVNYLKANQGAMFEAIREDSGEVNLEMVACYAYNRKKFLHKKIKAGEGLTGQCYLEQDVVYLTDVPENYVSITSGLGEALPRSVIIVPMMANNTVEGVVELAFFEELSAHKIDFLKQAGQSIAAFLSSERIRLQTQKLLEESQLNAEQFRAQEEEMRQNMEEMTVTQEQLGRQNEEFEAMMTAMNTTCGLAEFSSDASILSVNDLFCQLYGVRKEQMPGRKQEEIANRAKETEAYETLWQQLHNGKNVKLETAVQLSHTKRWLRENYTPIMDKSGKLQKVILISEDITDFLVELEV